MVVNKDAIKAWINENLVMRDEARKITGQSESGFNQAVQTGRIQSFVEFGDARITRLYLREDLVKYAENKRKQRGVDGMNSLKSLPNFEFDGKMLKHSGNAAGDVGNIITQFYTNVVENPRENSNHYDVTWDLTEFYKAEAAGTFEWPFPHAITRADEHSYSYFTGSGFTSLNKKVAYGVNELTLLNRPVKFGGTTSGECQFWGGAVDSYGNYYKVYWNILKIIEPCKIVMTVDKSRYCKKCLTDWSLHALESKACSHEWVPNE